MFYLIVGATGYDHEMINDLMAQTYAASVRWPRDKVSFPYIYVRVSVQEKKDFLTRNVFASMLADEKRF